MKQLTDQHILVKILPNFCFKRETEQERIERLDDAMSEWQQTGFELSLMESSESPEDYKEMMDDHIAQKPVSQEELEQLQIEPEILDQEDNQNQFFDSHIFWILMYLLGIGTGAMSVLLYQAIQMLP